MWPFNGSQASARDLSAHRCEPVTQRWRETPRRRRFIASDLSQSPDWAIVVQIMPPHHSRVDAMDDHDVISQTQTDEDILTFDVSDEALERTTSTERQAFTWIYCTGAWQYCPA